MIPWLDRTSDGGNYSYHSSSGSVHVEGNRKVKDF